MSRSTRRWLGAIVVLITAVVVGFGVASSDGAQDGEDPSETLVFPDQRLDDPLPPDLEEALIEEGNLEELEYRRGLKDGSLAQNPRVQPGPPVDDGVPRYRNESEGVLDRSLCQPFGFGSASVSPKMCWGQILDGGDSFMMVNVGVRRVHGNANETEPAIDISVVGATDSISRAGISPEALDAAIEGRLSFSYDDATRLLTLEAAGDDLGAFTVCARVPLEQLADAGCPEAHDETDHSHAEGIPADHTHD